MAFCLFDSGKSFHIHLLLVVRVKALNSLWLKLSCKEFALIDISLGVSRLGIY